MIVPLTVVLAVLVALSALFSMSEAAFLAINKVRLRHLKQRGSPPAKVAYQLLTELDRLIATLLISNSVVNTLITVLATIFFIQRLGPEHGPIWATVLVAMTLLVVAEITPKLFAAAHADRVALLLAFPLRAFMGLMRPLVWGFTKISHALIRLLGGKRLPRSPLVTEEELKVMIEMGREAGVLAESELRMLHSIFEFSDSLVRPLTSCTIAIWVFVRWNSPKSSAIRFVSGTEATRRIRSESTNSSRWRTVMSKSRA